MLTGNENLYKVTVRFPAWGGNNAYERDVYVIADSLDAALSATRKVYGAGKMVSIAELSINVIFAQPEPVAPPSQKEKP